MKRNLHVEETKWESRLEVKFFLDVLNKLLVLALLYFHLKKHWRNIPLWTQVLYKLTRRKMLHSLALNLPESISSPSHCVWPQYFHLARKTVLQGQRIVITWKKHEKGQLNRTVGSPMWQPHGSAVWAKQTAAGDPKWTHGPRWGLVHLLPPRFVSTNVALITLFCLKPYDITQNLPNKVHPPSIVAFRVL